MAVRYSELILYRYFPDDILKKMAAAANMPGDGHGPAALGELSQAHSAAARAQLVDDIYACLHEMVAIAESHGFEGNLWHGYLTYLLTVNENAFSLACEKRGAVEGSLSTLALHDLEIFREAYRCDWASAERILGVRFLGLMSNFKGCRRTGVVYSNGLRDSLEKLNQKLSFAESADEMYAALTDFYKAYGVGKFGLHRAFKLEENNPKTVILPVTRTEKVMLSDIVGYEIQKRKLVANTEAFVNGRKANNVLLYGDSGTGKSTSIKAILNEYYKDGLRMIEVYKHQFKNISEIIAQIKNRNYKFIIYMDDLSFEEFEIEYKYLKAVIEGGLETKPDNVLIYATSNRRHLIRETWNDRKQSSDDVHGGDSVQEKLSLATRFGESIYYGAPSQMEYVHIAKTLAARADIHMDEKEIETEAVRWEMMHGGLSGRTAKQFIHHLIGIAPESAHK